jgi:PTH2 family peptidyl-tRNA hydrolase
MIEEPNFYLQMKDNLSMDNNKSSEKLIDSFKEEQYKMVIAVRDDLKMGRGKIAAQVGHGGNIKNNLVLGAYKMALKEYPENIKNWEEISGTAKIVVSVNSEEELLKIRDKCKEKGLPFYLVRDAGRTQIAPGSITVCACGPGKVSDVDTVTGHLSLLN